MFWVSEILGILRETCFIRIELICNKFQFNLFIAYLACLAHSVLNEQFENGIINT